MRNLSDLIKRLFPQILQIVNFLFLLHRTSTPLITAVIQQAVRRACTEFDLSTEAVNLHNLEKGADFLRVGLLVYVYDVIERQYTGSYPVNFVEDPRELHLNRQEDCWNALIEIQLCNRYAQSPLKKFLRFDLELC